MDDLGVDLPDSFLWFTPFGATGVADHRVVEARQNCSGGRSWALVVHARTRSTGPEQRLGTVSEHVDAMFKLDRIHNLLIRR